MEPYYKTRTGRRKTVIPPLNDESAYTDYRYRFSCMDAAMGFVAGALCGAFWRALWHGCVLALRWLK
jgi:hypothetical protein